MNHYSEELELSDLNSYGNALKQCLNTPTNVLGESAAFLESMNSRRKYAMALMRVQIERELMLFTDEASKRTWRREEYKRCLTNEFYRLVRRYFGVLETPLGCAACNEYCYSERCCIAISTELNMYGCLQHASVHECVEKSITLGKKKFKVEADCPCVVTSAQTDVFCVFSGKITGKRLLESCSSSKDFNSDDAVTRSKAGFNFRLSMIEYDSIQDEYRNNDAAPSASTKRRRLQLKSTNLRKPDEKPSVVAESEYPPEFKHNQIHDGNDDDDDSVPELVERSSANASQEVAHSVEEQAAIAESATVAQQELEKREFLNNNNYFQFKKDTILQEAERYLVGFAETIILDLLYDKEARQLLNEEQIFRVSSEMTASLSAYHSAQKRAKEMPNYISCLSAFYTPQASLKLLRLVEYDRLQISMFSERAVDLWKLCFRSPAYILGRVETCTFKRFAVALLYCMKTGVAIPARGLAWAENTTSAKIQIVKHEMTIENDLPDENLLRSFGKVGKDAVRKVLQTGAVGAATTTTTNTHQQLGDVYAMQQHRSRVTHIDTIPQRIQVDGVGVVMCKTFLPKYLQEEVIGDTSSYSSSDVSLGMSFFKDCVASFSEENRQLLSLV